MKEGECIDCWYFYGSPVGCHNEYANESDEKSGGCIFFDPKWEPPSEDEQGKWEAYQKEWN